MAKKIFTLMAIIITFSRVGVIAGDFTDNGDGTVTDDNTGLMWQQTEAGSKNWEDAIIYCEGLSLAGYTDWRLPNIKELRSIIDDRIIDGAIETDYFPDAHMSEYWSSTTSLRYTENAWYVNFSQGSVNLLMDKSNYLYVRCVRGGQ